MGEKEEEEERDEREVKERALPVRRSPEDELLFLRARPVSRLMNCIIGNPEYKLGFAITSSDG